MERNRLSHQDDSAIGAGRKVMKCYFLPWSEKKNPEGRYFIYFSGTTHGRVDGGFV